ncbi:cupin domain-containing protein [Nocardiopsis aegyptia]|uniref:Mannose-6-phosphate isomerase-like protein (Cupin superfamily) n=1 Tax=Nocardiopsis aegyptia TaxID=220378 RepID=A0A7Z0EUN8_9ACTN|nr:hypothetical protein [Nocardiopsis aegyptia]NYJ38151.1 mannose-6-phosphate isomerase-like protein (cupin superfamily) [Nocardiopsis aegyptia]
MGLPPSAESLQLQFFLVLDGILRIRLRRDADSPERVVDLARGAVFTVSRGTEHRPESDGGASILLFEPTGTLTVGDRNEDVPAHVDATAGHPLEPGQGERPPHTP